MASEAGEIQGTRIQRALYIMLMILELALPAVRNEQTVLIRGVTYYNLGNLFVVDNPNFYFLKEILFSYFLNTIDVSVIVFQMSLSFCLMLKR